MKKWLLKVKTTNKLQGPISIRLHEKANAYGALRNIADQMLSGSTFYSLPGYAEIDPQEVTELAVVEYEATDDQGDD